VVQDPARVFLV